MIKRLCIIVVSFLITSVFAQGKNKIVAKVNNEVITLRDVETYSKLFAVEAEPAQLLIQALRNLIEERLIIQSAKKEQYEISPHQIEGKLKTIIASYGSRKTFEEFLVSQGINLVTMKERIKDDLLIRKAIDRNVNSQVSISPKEITDYYNENIDQFESLPEYVCWVAKSNKQIFLEKVANEISKEGLEPVIDHYKEVFFKIESDEQGLKDEVKDVVTSLEEDEYRIKEIDGACYLIYLKSVVPPHKKFLAEVKDEIYAYLWKKKFEKRFTEWIDQLRHDAVIRIYD